jgi:hypothetical protein
VGEDRAIEELRRATKNDGQPLERRACRFSISRLVLGNGSGRHAKLRREFVL